MPRTRMAWIYDARVLVWLLAWVFLTGIPLMVLFDTDPAQYAASLVAWRPWGHILRALHAASTSLLVVGMLAHLVLRMQPRRVVRGVDPSTGGRGGSKSVRGVDAASVSQAVDTAPVDRGPDTTFVARGQDTVSAGRVGGRPRDRAAARPPTRRPAPSRAGVRTGAMAMAAVALAAISGAMIAQDGAATRLLAWSGLAGVGRIELWLAVVHIAYATILVLLTVYLHIARWGWAYVFASGAQATSAAAVTALTALLLGSTVPGSDAVWSGATWIAVPPVPVLWAWTLLVALVVWLLAGPITARRASSR